MKRRVHAVSFILNMMLCSSFVSYADAVISFDTSADYDLFSDKAGYSFDGANSVGGTGGSLAHSGTRSQAYYDQAFHSTNGLNVSAVFFNVITGSTAGDVAAVGASSQYATKSVDLVTTDPGAAGLVAKLRYDGSAHVIRVQRFQTGAATDTQNSSSFTLESDHFYQLIFDVEYTSGSRFDYTAEVFDLGTTGVDTPSGIGSLSGFFYSGSLSGGLEMKSGFATIDTSAGRALNVDDFSSSVIPEIPPVEQTADVRFNTSADYDQFSDKSGYSFDATQSVGGSGGSLLHSGTRSLAYYDQTFHSTNGLNVSAVFFNVVTGSSAADVAAVGASSQYATKSVDLTTTDAGAAGFVAKLRYNGSAHVMRVQRFQTGAATDTKDSSAFTLAADRFYKLAFNVEYTSGTRFDYTAEVFDLGTAGTNSPISISSYSSYFNSGALSGGLVMKSGFATVDSLGNRALNVDDFSSSAIIAPAVDGYEGWVEEFGLTGADTNMTADLEYGGLGDGMDNLLEYALGGNPTNDDAAVVLPTASLSGDGSWFYHVHNERTDDTNVVYTVKRVSNLIDGTWETNGVNFVGASTGTNDFRFVTNRTDIGMQEFVRLIVELN